MQLLAEKDSRAHHHKGSHTLNLPWKWKMDTFQWKGVNIDYRMLNQGKETIHPASKHPSSLAKWHSRSKGPNICLSIVAFSWFAFSNTRLENADVNRPKATKKDTPGVVPGVVRILFIWRVWKELGGATWGHYQSWNGSSSRHGRWVTSFFAGTNIITSWCLKPPSWKMMVKPDRIWAK